MARMTHHINKKAFKKSFWSSISRLIGVALGAGAGSIIHKMIGDGTLGWEIACTMAAISFGCMLFAEYEREREE